jgi:hypothetical protein
VDQAVSAISLNAAIISQVLHADETSGADKITPRMLPAHDSSNFICVSLIAHRPRGVVVMACGEVIEHDGGLPIANFRYFHCLI